MRAAESQPVPGVLAALQPDAAAAEFRAQVRAFFRGNLPAELAWRVRNYQPVSAAETVAWQKRLQAQGWFAPAWPVEWGGTGWTPLQQYLYDHEYHAAGAPLIVSFGRDLLAPILMRHASPAQQQFYLPRILASDDWWCQGYSEPGAGSDLASLKTRAERRGDVYVVNGQKTWTTLGQHANRMFCLVRTGTGARRQEGISFLLIDLQTPGITVRPIVLLDGTAEVNEVWFENVEVPVANRVGAEGHGWNCAKQLLGHERNTIAGIGIAWRELDYAWELARRVRRSGRPLAEDPRFRDRIARLEVDLLALDMTNLRLLSAPHGAQPGWEVSMLKVRGTEIQQGITELLLGIAGPLAACAPTAGPGDDLRSLAPALVARYLNRRKLSIFGGSNEIQRNIIAGLLLG
ncbi:MAG: pimeloyl-CoA dehydrogenase large subunit [Gammaproteobacteria bacterium]|nr:pimeloyl-CoA dehydrogenase large subunit [Gammaproteobacteria bacterium]